MGLLILGFLPSITAPKGYAARLSIGAAFQKYYNSGLDKNASGFVKGRARCARKWGLTTEDISTAEISIISAAVINTVPNVFHMLCYIFSDLELVAAIRKETAKIATRKIQDGFELVSLNIALLQTHCPLLTASFYETLRLTKTGASVRTTLSDVLLDNQYLLKKGAIIQIPTGVLQSNVNTWGDDSKAFNPRRFIEKESLSKEAKKAQTRAFIPFGGGKNLCPGRHLAFTEITAFVAMMVYGFDVEMNDGGVLQVPEAEFQRLGVGSLSPKKDVAVLIQRREEFGGVTWQFDTGNGDG
jgi:cytochrome P450